MNPKHSGLFQAKRPGDKHSELELANLQRSMGEIKAAIDNWYANVEKLEREMPSHMKKNVTALYDCMSYMLRKPRVMVNRYSQTSPKMWEKESPPKASVNSEEILSHSSIQTTSDEADWYAESKEKAKKFEWKVMPLVCSSRGEYFLLDGSENWENKWKRMLSRGSGTHWCTPIMLPKEYGSHVVIVGLERVREVLNIVAWYHYSTPPDVPSITLDCVGNLRFHRKTNQAPLQFQRKSSFSLVHPPHYSLMFMFPGLPWEEFDENVTPSFKLRILPCPLEENSHTPTPP